MATQLQLLNSRLLLAPEPIELAFVGIAGGRHVIKLVRKELEARIPGVILHVYPDVPDIAAVRVVVVANPPTEQLEAFTNLELVVSIWAGVEHIAKPGSLPGVQIARYVDETLEATMTEAVLTHVLNVHRNTYQFLDLQAGKQWEQAFYDRPETLTVGVLGLGALGADAARTLAEHGFTTLGWARTPKDIPGVEAFAGPEGLNEMLVRCDVVVCLLPLTHHTEGVLNTATMNLLKPGATVINVARGGHVEEGDLIELLDSGHLGMAILDVFATEPLPQDDPLWNHPKVKVFPHIAAPTDREQASVVAATAVRAFLDGTPIRGLVDRELGY